MYLKLISNNITLEVFAEDLWGGVELSGVAVDFAETRKKTLCRRQTTSGRTWTRVCITSFTGSPAEDLGRQQRLVLDRQTRYPKPAVRGRKNTRAD